MGRTTDIRPLHVTTATVTLAEVRELRGAPDIRSVRGVRRVGTDQYEVQVVYVGAVEPYRRRRHRTFQFEGVGRFLRVLAIVIGIPAVGWLVWVLFGAAITAAVKLIATAVATIALIVLGTWLLSAKTGVCPGLHCPGCPHK